MRATVHIISSWRLQRAPAHHLVCQHRRRPSAAAAAAMGQPAANGADKALHPDVDRVLFTQKAIADRTAEVGRQLAEDYRDKQPLLLGTLTGAFMFCADLARAIQPVPAGLSIDFVRASSYHGAATATSGQVEVSGMQKLDVKGRHVLLVEDIVDTGGTALKLQRLLLAAGAASVRLVALLDKAERRTVDLTPDYVCFRCPDEFVIGYGLDFNEAYRSLPYVGVLKPALYQ